MSWLCYFRALQLGDVNKVVPIDKCSTVLTMILAFLILKEPITAAMGGGILLIAAGTYLMVEKKKTSVMMVASGSSWFLYAWGAAVFAGLTAILGKIGIEDVESYLGTAIRTLVVLVFAWVMVFLQNKQREIKDIDKRSWFFILLSGVTTGLSWLCYYTALQTGRASVIVPIDKLSILMTAAFAHFILKERLGGKAFAGLALLVAGTLMLLL